MKYTKKKEIDKRIEEMEKNPRIEYGNVELDEDEFDPKYAKFRVTMFINLAVLDNIRKVAKERGIPYQTLINQTLTDIYSSDQPALSQKDLLEMLFKLQKQVDQLNEWKAAAETKKKRA